MDLKVISQFDWAHRGVQVETFEKGRVFSTEDPDLIRVSLAEKWTQKSKQAPENKDNGNSPENKQTPSGDDGKQAAGDQGEANAQE